MSQSRIKAYILLLIVSAIWGVATPVIKFTLSGIGPSSFLTYRFFLASLFGLIVLYSQRSHFRRMWNNARQIFLYSIFATTIALGLLFLGLNRTTVLDTILITAVSPLVTAVFGVIFLNERITHQEKLGIGIAFVGTLITVLEPVLTGKVDTIKLSGNVLVIGYLLTNGYAAVLGKKLVRKRVSSFNLSNISFIIGFLTILPLTLVRTPPAQILSNVQNLSAPHHMGVFYMAFISGTLAYALWIKGQKSIEISEAGVFAYLMPIFSAPLAVFWLGEKITIPFIIGAIIITIGVVIAEYKRSRKQKFRG